MTIATLLRAALTGDTAVAAIVSTRIYPVKLPQTPTYEAISYARVSNTERNGSTALRETRFQINCWADTYIKAGALAAAVKTALEGYTNTSQTPGIKMALVVNELDDYDDEVKVYREIVDVILTTTGD